MYLKDIKINLYTVLILIMFSGIFLLSSCNKDDYYYFEYKNLPSTKKDSLNLIEQCVVSRRPKSSKNFLTVIIKGKYLGQKIIYYPNMNIKCFNANDKLLFEKELFVRNFKICNYGGNFYWDLFVSKDYPEFATSTFIDISEFKDEYAFTYEDIHHFEISIIGNEADNINVVDTDRVVIETPTFEKTLIKSNFTISQSNGIKFQDNLVEGLIADNNGIYFDYTFGDVKPKLSYSPGDKGYFIFDDEKFVNVKTSKININYTYQIDTITTKSIKAYNFQKQLENFNFQRKLNYEIYKANIKN